MSEVKHLDWDAIARDYQAGISADQCAAKYGCHHTTVRVQLGKRGIYKPGRPRQRRDRGEQADSHALMPAGAKPLKVFHVDEPQASAPTPNGHARCRVAMFEVEGSETAVRDAVNAIKAALENRSA